MRTHAFGAPSTYKIISYVIIRRLARKGLKFSKRHPDDKSHPGISEAEARRLIISYWERLCHARLFYALQDMNLVLANDEMCIPLESHAKIIYELAGVRHPLIFSNHMERLTFTVLFTFTLTGRRLSLVFIFKAEEKGRLYGQSKDWARDWLPEGQNAHFFFSPSGVMNEWLYFQVLGLLYVELLEPYVQEKNMPAVRRLLVPEWLDTDHEIDALSHLGEEEAKFPKTHILHDRATAHNTPRIARLLRNMNSSFTLVFPTGYVQIFDVGLARIIRAGLFNEHNLWFHQHPDTDVDLANYRKLVTVFLCRIWFVLVTDDQIVKLCLITGSANALDGSDDAKVDVRVGREKLNFTAAPEAAIEKFNLDPHAIPLVDDTSLETVSDSNESSTTPTTTQLERFHELGKEIKARYEARVAARQRKKKGAVDKSKKKKALKRRPKTAKPKSKRGRGGGRGGGSHGRGRSAANAHSSRMDEEDIGVELEDSDTMEDVKPEISSSGDEEEFEVSISVPHGFIPDDAPLFVSHDNKSNYKLNDLLLVRGIPSAGDEKPFYVAQLIKDGDMVLMHYRNNEKLELYGSYDLSVYQDGKGKEILLDPLSEAPGPNLQPLTELFHPEWLLAWGFKLDTKGHLPAALIAKLMQSISKNKSNSHYLHGNH